MSKITIGTAPCSWGVWWPDGTPSGTPYNVFLDQAAQAGYKTLELGPVGYLPEDVEQLKDELGRRGLSVCGGTACFEFLRAASFREVRPQVDDICRRLRAFDVPYLMTMDGCPIDRVTKAKLGGKKAETYDLFGEMGRYCRETYGIEVLMHPERCSLIETKTDLEELMERNLKICFDNGHYAAANGGWEKRDQSALDFMRRYADHIPYLHFKNCSGEIRRRELAGELAPNAPEFDDMMCLLEDGIIDYEQVRDLLNELDFQGVAIIEQDCPHSTADEAFAMAKRNLQYLQRIGMIAE